MKHILRSIASLAAGASLCACTLDIPYENQFSDPDAITSAATARELLASAYASLPNPEFDLSLLADDFTPTYWAASNPSLNNEYTWQPQALVDLSASLWSSYYSVVATANAVIERLPAVTDDPAACAAILAEARMLKAYVYFDLLRLFAPDYADGADSPGIILKDRVEMQTLPRSTVEECTAEIRRLLTAAIDAGCESAGEEWLSLQAARYLLAELELYAGNAAEARAQASAVIAGADAGALAQYDRLWGGDACAERIFVNANVDVAGSFYLDIMYDRDGGDYFAVEASLAASYAAADVRRAWSVCEVTTPTMGYQPYFGKYNLMRRNGQEITFINKLRLAGACYILAEACCAAGDDDAARDAVNACLSARGADELPSTLSGTALLQAILAEKHKEFVGEGTRYFDLKRYRRSALAAWTASQSANRRIAADDYRWTLPLPKDEYLYNENVEQNPGWPVYSFE